MQKDSDGDSPLDDASDAGVSKDVDGDVPTSSEDGGSGESSDSQDSNLSDGEDPETDLSDPAVEDVSSIAYVYIDLSELPSGSSQNIVIGLKDENLLVDEAKLTLLEKASGQDVSVELTRSVEGALLFEIPSSLLSLGDYSVKSLEYSAVDGEGALRVDFTEDSEPYEFEVVEASDEPSSQDVEDATTAYTVDESGSLVEVGGIDEAVEEAAAAQQNSGISLFSLDSETPSTKARSGSSDFVVVLDPGHGGVDGGAPGLGVREADVNLAIAKACRDELQKYAGVQVYMTRENDSTVELRDRVQFAVDHDADLVVSIHNNSSTNSSAHGAEVIVPREGNWYYQETFVTGNQLGEKILAKLVALGLSGRDVYSRPATSGDKYADGTPMDYYTMISGPREYGILGIIVEHAFVSNPSDAAFLSSNANLKALGQADAQAIVQQYGLTKWNVTGIKASSSVMVGSSVTVSPITSGNVSSVKYNYGWQRNGSWADGEWDSTLNSTGSYTSSKSWTFKPTKAGTYTLFIDAVILNSQGKVTSQKTVYKEITVTPWNLKGINGAPKSMFVGEKATISPNITGDVKGVTYNYVWQRNGSWADGDWGSTVKSTGKNTSATSWTFSPTKAGTYTLFVDVQSGAYKRTVQKTVRVSQFAVTGVDCPSKASTGQKVTFKAVAKGGLSGATYNYVWQRNGSWADGEWGSTVLSTGKMTSSSTGSFTPTRSGTYTLAVDVKVGGETQTVTTGKVVVTDPWTAKGITGAPSAMLVGEKATVKPSVSGNLSGVTYNYVWQRNGSWADGDWGSTVKSTGKNTSATSWTFSPTKAGTYTLFVDVQSGAYKRTVQKTVRVSQFAVTGVDCPSKASTGQKVTFKAVAKGGLSGATYNYVWQRNGSWADGEWGSTVLSTGKMTSSSTGSFTPTRSGTYTLAVDVKVGGETQTVTTGKVVVTDPWTAKGITGVPKVVGAGEKVTMRPNVTGDLSGVTYNYVWQYNNWSEWGSTVKSTGKNTSATSWSFTPTKLGTYTLYIDVQSGAYKRTVQTTLTVGHQIMGTSEASKQSMINYLKSYCSKPGNSYPSVYASKGAATVEEFVNILWSVAASEGVRADVVFSQMIVETGGLQFGGDVKVEQCNFAGIGATGGVSGNSFKDVREGLLAQVQHLKAYASTAPLNNEKVDPRFDYVQRGCAKYIEELTGKWAASSTYADSIIDVLDQL